MSVLLVPGELTENYFEATKHGNLSKVWYDSPTIGMKRRMFVYTPYGYDTSNKNIQYSTCYMGVAEMKTPVNYGTHPPNIG